MSGNAMAGEGLPVGVAGAPLPAWRQAFKGLGGFSTSTAVTGDLHALNQHRAHGLAAVGVRVGTDADDLLEHLAEVAGDGDFLHRVLDDTVLDPVAGRAARASVVPLAPVARLGSSAPVTAAAFAAVPQSSLVAITVWPLKSCIVGLASALAMPKVQMLPDEPAQTNPPHTAAAPISSTGMMPCRSASRPGGAVPLAAPPVDARPEPLAVKLS